MVQGGANPPGSRQLPARARGVVWVWIAVAIASLASPPIAAAAGTSPVLMLSAVDTFSAPGGRRMLTATGAFNFDDLVQTSFPAVGLMVVQGSRFVRYEVDGTMIEGTSSLVGDGIALAELPAILQISGAALAPARMTHLNRDEVSVVLPADLAAGPAFALLYAHHQNEYFLSPAITVVLP